MLQACRSPCRTRQAAAAAGRGAGSDDTGLGPGQDLATGDVGLVLHLAAGRWGRLRPTAQQQLEHGVRLAVLWAGAAERKAAQLRLARLHTTLPDYTPGSTGRARGTRRTTSKPRLNNSVFICSEWWKC